MKAKRIKGNAFISGVDVRNDQLRDTAVLTITIRGHVDAVERVMRRTKALLKVDVAKACETLITNDGGA